jgi:outer membrane protein assembly factor BamB
MVGKGDANAPPTPLVGEEGVYAVAADGQVLCCDHSGKVKWNASVAPPAAGRIGSPLIRDGVLVVQGAALTGLSPATGQVVWTTEMPPGVDVYTPGAARCAARAGQAVLLLSSGMMVRADGLPLSRYNPADRNGPPPMPGAPVAVGSKVYYAGARPDGSESIVQVFDMDAQDKRSRGKPVRRTYKDFRLVGSPLVLDELVHALTDKQELVAFDQAAALVYREKLTDAPEVTPAGAELCGVFQGPSQGPRMMDFRSNVVYAAGVGQGNRIVAVRAGKKFEKLWEQPVGEGMAAPAGGELERRPARASVNLAFQGTRLYVRAGDRLYCLRNHKAEEIPKPPPETQPAAEPASQPATAPTTRKVDDEAQP